MKPYLSLLWVRFLSGLQYRAAAFGGLATQFFWGLMLIFIFSAFYGDAAYSNGFSYRDLVTYIWLQQAFLMFFILFDWDAELFDMITTGGISYELCRPINLYQMWYVKLLSKRLASGLLTFSPVVTLGFLLPEPYNLSLPQSPLSFTLFVVSLFLALFLLVSISMMIYISVFKTMHPAGSMLIIGMAGGFLQVIPYPFRLCRCGFRKLHCLCHSDGRQICPYGYIRGI